MDSASHLRRMTRDGPLSIYDISKRPELFFFAPLLAHAVGLVYGTRFIQPVCGERHRSRTDEQARILEEIERDQQLGCFALTERSAGVLSGLIVETTAEYVPDEDAFVINTPHEGAAKTGSVKDLLQNGS